MYNYSVSYKDLSTNDSFLKGLNIDADDIMQCFLIFNQKFPCGFIHGVKLND